MEYTISRFMKSALSIGIFILLLMTLPYIAMFVIAIPILGIVAWYGYKIIKGVKNIIYKLSTKGKNDVKPNIYNSEKYADESDDINYSDSAIIDVDYEKVE
jgi:ABC-type proline/glycine betaine transport system permease subunit